MGTVITAVAIVIVGIVVGLGWERLQSFSRKRKNPAKNAADPSPVSPVILAYSFQSDLSFANTALFLGMANFGEWYERDSHWYPQLLTCRSHRGMGMNLYFLDGENILELKFLPSESSQPAAEAFALHELLPALGARSIKRTCGVN